MERLTKSNVKVDPTAAKYMGKEVNIQGMNDRLLDLVLNGPTLNGVSKDVLRQIIRQLYDGLAHYEDMEEQGRLVVLPCKPGTHVYHIKWHFCEHWNKDECNTYCDGYSEDCEDYEGNPEIVESIYRPLLPEEGRHFWLTREEAENALKGGAK